MSLRGRIDRRFESPEGDAVEALTEGCDALLDHMRSEYKSWSDMSCKYDGDTESRRSIRDDMYKEFAGSLHYYKGKKYIKVVGDNSVRAFVVACTNDKKFEFGDILMPAGWKAPARNFRRGNVLDRTFDRVSWSGVH
ncbi:MAG: hypothetical protein QGH83_00600 [Candidatus Pacebacteria bacterium]|jgi:hypothetical protein|nr:hypothetical protein [Candidatus Paceibacterota bacterium]|tara:strand:- start:63 stop:473 length:411 start_codon:yes stop_codon:yes gene_type:complete